MRRAALMALSCMLLGGCASHEPLTEILLVVDTDLAVREGQVPEDAIEVIRLELLVAGAPPRTGFTAVLDEGYAEHVDPPVSWGLLAVTDPDGELDVFVRGYPRLAPTALPVVEKHARVRFVAGEVRVLCMDLMAACAGVECTGATTCHADASGVASCVSVLVDEERLPAYVEGDVTCPDEWPAP